MIEVEGLRKSYGSIEALRGISFSVAEGSVVGFLGPNGAGKSTTLRIMSGFLAASAGRVSIAGFDVVEQRRQALTKLGYMPETSPLYPEMRVSEYLRFRAELKGVTRRKRKTEVDRVLGDARVRDMAGVSIGHLSKGYRQRVGLADALLGSPPLLILDEPTAGLDPNQIREVRSLIRSLADGHTVLISTHILSEVEMTCDEALVISKGKLVASGPLDDLRNRAVATEIELVVTGDKVAASKLIKKQPAVRSVKRRGALDGGTRIVVRFHKAELERDGKIDHGPATERIVAALTGGGLGVRRVQPLGWSLEKVFSQLTQDTGGSDRGARKDRGKEREA